VFIRQVDGVFDEHFSTAMGSCLEIELVHTTNLIEVHHFAPVLIGSEEGGNTRGVHALVLRFRNDDQVARDVI
jgi:hypothetical protein